MKMLFTKDSEKLLIVKDKNGIVFDSVVSCDTNHGIIEVAFRNKKGLLLRDPISGLLVTSFIEIECPFEIEWEATIGTK